VRPFENSVPLYDLKVAAGRFSGEQQAHEVPGNQTFDAHEFDWVELPRGRKPARDLFVAQVVGESMNRRIPNGSFCLFRARPQGDTRG
jgi:phage repressor protein C with HTH and peptisase S24 domain